MDVHSGAKLTNTCLNVLKANVQILLTGSPFFLRLVVSIFLGGRENDRVKCTMKKKMRITTETKVSTDIYRQQSRFLHSTLLPGNDQTTAHIILGGAILKVRNKDGIRSKL